MFECWGRASALFVFVQAAACDAVIIIDPPFHDGGAPGDGDGPPANGGGQAAGGTAGIGGASASSGGSSTGGGGDEGGGPSTGGGSCDADLTLPSGEPTVVGSGLDRPVGIALVGEDIYVTQTGSGVSNGALVRLPKLGGPVEVLASDQRQPWAVTADSQYVYWVDRGEGEDGSLHRLSLADDAVEVLAEKLRYPWGIAAHGGSLYATELNNNRVIAIGPDKSLSIVTAAFTGLPIAVDDSGVYVGVIGLGSWNESISRVDTQGNPSVLYEQLAPSDILVMDGDDLFFSESGSLRRGKRDGSSVVTLADVSMLGRIDAVVADCFVYFAVQEDTYVGRVPVDGGDVQVLAPSEALPSAIAVDDDAIYWVNQASGTVVRLAK
ncbi:MAG: hypothetical protein JNK04_08175 [Myxococcales bacterium]|nr:hypothetical protein [Myxococcales bacterium]